MKYFKLFRIKHYVKNLIIFLPLVFSGYLLNVSNFISVVIGFSSFSLITSFVYIINDINDIEYDRKHPVKCKRPIPSGAISIRIARLLGICSLIVSLFLLFYLLNAQRNIFIFINLVLYLLNNLLYTYKLKQIAILDVFSIVVGFLIRSFFGAAIINVSVSSLLYLTIMALAFYLGYGKRRNEINVMKNGETRKVLENYNFSFLDKNMNICVTLAVVFYSLWVLEMDSVFVSNIFSLITTVPIILIILMRYSLVIEGDSDGDPTEVIFGDKLLVGLTLFYAMYLLVILYW